MTALLHHVTVERLRAAYRAIRPGAAAGVDGVTWHEYGRDLQDNLEDLHGRVHRGGFRASPSLRVVIAKSDGRLRPLGVPVLEDKIVQRAVVEVLNAVYEEDFLGFSYGFRPGRGAHDALDALAAAIQTRKVNWVLDADIRGFFDAIDHEWLMRFVEHRIADQRVLRLIAKWLRAGVIEDGSWTPGQVGSPQGAAISPLLANVYLHYVFDLWAHQWRQRESHGDVVIVRYADDFVVGFEHRRDAERFLVELRERFAQFALALHPDKTRLIEFGRFAERDRRGRGDGKPQTFGFLGFTHYCAKTRRGRFRLGRKTIAKRMAAKLRSVKDDLRWRRHHAIPEQGKWLRSVVKGHLNYFAVPGNSTAIRAFRDRVIRHWLRALRRRSQRSRLPWPRMKRIADHWLPPARILHPYPDARFAASTQSKSPVR